ncbi:RNA-directed DNA polymerase from mobile element jockey [Plakobranchus ocellatus]|uniref:RNA-directed DNA polymerase from mobile element jockey n=1 Tax=Plakobranchus ocellatus TaxID=259542 RepID=A0AAV4DSB0_9GAST|nr:RNA-directed DNA polymerase from mobile element jockey [Plakobranchus ocellatus]
MDTVVLGFRSNFEELKLLLNRSQSAVVALQECRLGEGQVPPRGYTLLLLQGGSSRGEAALLIRNGTRFSEIDLKIPIPKFRNFLWLSPLSSFRSLFSCWGTSTRILLRGGTPAGMGGGENLSNHYAVFTDGSKLGEKVAAAAYFPEHPDRSKATRLRDGASVFSAELEGIALALTEIKKLTKYHKNFVIYSDSLSALQAIQSKNFKVIDIRRLYNLIRKFPPYVHISFVWIPAHVGIQGMRMWTNLLKRP